MNKKTEHYSEAETKRRFEAALHGARIAGAQHKEGATPKQPKAQSRKRKKKEQKDRA